MTTVVTLPAPRQGRPAQAGHEVGATILFFTGVRYVRDMPEPDLDPDETEPEAVPAPDRDARAAV